MTHLDHRFALGSSTPLPEPDDEAYWASVVADGDAYVVGNPACGNVVPITNGTKQPGMAERLLARSQLRDIPAPSPLIEETLDLGTVAVLAGYKGTLKSFVALDWAASVATATPWRHRPAKRRRVLYVAAEGAQGLDNRLTAWETTQQVDLGDDQFTVLPMRVHLLHPSEVTELAALVFDGEYGFVVVDTLAKCTTGIDENSSKDMGIAVESLYRIQAATNGGTVLCVHHTGKDRTNIRGSSSLEAGVETVYTTEGDWRNMKLSRTKRKDGPEEDIHTLSFQAVAGTDSGVVMSVGGADMAGRARDLLSVFLSAFATNGATKSDLRNAADMPPATFFRSLETLVSTGKLINTGTDTRPFYKLVP